MTEIRHDFRIDVTAALPPGALPPVSSTMPTHSCPIDWPPGVTGIEW